MNTQERVAAILESGKTIFTDADAPGLALLSEATLSDIETELESMPDSAAPAPRPTYGMKRR